MIRRLLVADRGMVARRIFATCRAIGVETAAVIASSHSIREPHAAEADVAVRLPPSWGDDGHVTDRDIADLLSAASRCGADALHPGQSWLAADQDVANAVIDAGLTWVGPCPKTLATISSKVDTRTLLADAGLPVLPVASAPGEVSAFPIIVKPAMGRGGRGMRVVRGPGSLVEAFASARREAALIFGESTVFCERYIEPARHIVVQIVADAAGTVVPLGERECSVQHHRQRILEEAPSPGVDPGLRAELFTAAVAAARALGFTGIGTVQFMLAPSGEFHFLKITSWLDAGHTVTECVFGIDLVRLQLLVAEGGTLPFAAPPPLRGHAVSVRLTAEDPAYDWRPCDGVVHRFQIPGVLHTLGPLLVPGLRLDAAVADGSVLRSGDDPLLGTVTAWSPTRHEAARTLATALTEAQLHGVATNRDLLVRVLRHPMFLTGDVQTDFLNRHPEVFAPLLSSLDAVRLSCLAATLAGSAMRKAAGTPLASLPTGWRNVPSGPQTVAYQGPTGAMEVAYQFDRHGVLSSWSVAGPHRDGFGRSTATAGEESHNPQHAKIDLTVVSTAPDQVWFEVNGVRVVFHVHAVDGSPPVYYVDSREGSVALAELPRFPLPMRPWPHEEDLTIVDPVDLRSP